MDDRAYTEDLFTKLAQTEGASDLIVTTAKPPQLRIYGELVPIGSDDLTPEDSQRICQSILNQEQIKSFKEEKEFDFSLCLDGTGRYRVNMYFQQGFMALAARIIPDKIPSFEQLKLPIIIRKLAMLKQGLVLITGPVGSGKSTTITSMIDYINSVRHCHIISIEDPIEYVHENMLSTIDQREVGIDTKSFEEALRRVLRQSMDVVVVGEIRDRASAQAAMTLAETGHLTLATLHTRGTIASASRLIDMFSPEKNHQIRMQLASALAGVIWQQLIPGIDEQSLIASCEIMVVTAAIRALIRQNRTQEIYSLIQSGKKFGMCTMQDAVRELVDKKMISENWANLDLLQIQVMLE
ncbi:MAG: PilT/PilU family type 4a pilus ATPase [Planctomycetes bacterium]|nr:PilT/PilU family type 4a pilus ATPase [Planctomycetota bacterium]